MLGEQVIYRPEPGARGRNMRGTFILPPPDKFDAFCAELQRLERARRVAEGEAPGPDITFDICVRTPYVIEYTNGSLELLTAAEASLLLPDNPPLQIEVPQGPAPVIQLDVGHSPFESKFSAGVMGRDPSKVRRFQVLDNQSPQWRVVRASGLSHAYILASARCPRGNARRAGHHFEDMHDLPRRIV